MGYSPSDTPDCSVSAGSIGVHETAAITDIANRNAPPKPKTILFFNASLSVE